MIELTYVRSPCLRLVALAAGCALTLSCTRAVRAPLPRPPAASEPITTLDLGPLQVTVVVSRTAQLFHIVDQLSNWSQYCHRQYARWLERRRPLNDDDKRLLATHAALRRRLGWGGGMEQALYVDPPLGDAFAAAVAKGILTQEEASLEQGILLHFEPVLQHLIGPEKAHLEAFRVRLAGDAPRLRDQAKRFAAFADVQGPIEVPAFLVADPEAHDAGGGYNGGRLVLEVPGDTAAGEALFLHEVFHAFLHLRQKEFATAALACGAALDPQTLQEGVAYAFAPGLVHAGDGDPLAAEVAAESTRPLGESYVRFRRFGFALRNLLAEALDEGTPLEPFLERACPVWRGLSASAR